MSSKLVLLPQAMKTEAACNKATNAAELTSQVVAVKVEALQLENSGFRAKGKAERK